jgi:hypothetical protein
MLSKCAFVLASAGVYHLLLEAALIVALLARPPEGPTARIKRLVRPPAPIEVATRLRAEGAVPLAGRRNWAPPLSFGIDN